MFGTDEQKQTIAVQLEELGDRIGIVHLHLEIHDQRATSTEQPAAERWRGLAASINPALTQMRTGRNTPRWSTRPPPPASTSPPSCRRCSPPGPFTRADQLFRHLKAARLDNSIEAEIRRLTRVELLIIDDFALQPMDQTETADFYERIIERHHKTATITTSNRDASEWIGLMSDPWLAQQNRNHRRRSIA